MENIQIPETLPQSNKAVQEERKERANQMQQMVLDGSDVVDQSEAIRLPNMIKRSSDMMEYSQTGGSVLEKEMTMSPT